MEEQLIICPKCGGNACHEASNNKLTVWSCFGCGFTSNTTLVENNLENIEAVMPQLYKDLKFKDEKGYYWYPNTVMLDDKSMVFAEGTDINDWKWSSVQSKDGKADMSTKKEYEINGFMDALEHVGYFKYAQQE
jgi:hypothetical protein